MIDTAELRKAAKAVYLATIEPVAKDLSSKLTEAATEIDRLRAELAVGLPEGEPKIEQIFKHLEKHGIVECKDKYNRILYLGIFPFRRGMRLELSTEKDDRVLETIHDPQLNDLVDITKKYKLHMFDLSITEWVSVQRGKNWRDAK